MERGRMLLDLSNASEGSLSSPAHSPNKRSWDGTSDGGDIPFQAKRRLAQSNSSSSSIIGTSSPFGGDSRFRAYDAPSSPFAPSKLSTSPSRPQIIAEDSARDRSGEGVPSPSKINRGKLEVAAAQDRLTIRLEQGVRLQFGRKAKKTLLEPSSDTTVPILLPQSAKNASRLHCSVQLLPSSTENEGEKTRIQVRVFGQNGMRVDGKLWEAGEVVEFEVEPGQTVKLYFWGWTALVKVPGEMAAKEKSGTSGVVEEKEVTSRKLSPLLSTPARLRTVIADSSPFNSLFDGSEGRASSPVASSKDPFDDRSTLGDLESVSRPPSPVFSVLSDLSSSPAPEEKFRLESEDDEDNSNTHLTARAQELAKTLALDLPGLIASAIVFHPRSTVGVQEVVEGLLREVGGMWDVLEGGKGDSPDKEHEQMAVDAWWDTVEDVLKSEPFFACIANAGLRDAAGNPVPPAYYYLPDSDPSKSRVEALEPFVKRVRGARVEGGGKRYFWRRPCLKKNR
ncbi:hypothetical protein T439DRAFT_325350 [Meredithblackwellia eburnea MCA 4105]